MCCFSHIKRESMIFFICLNFISLSNAHETLTPTPDTPSLRFSIATQPYASGFSWYAKGFISLMLLSTRVQAFSSPSQPSSGPPHLSLNPVHSDGLITGWCYFSCTQKCAPKLMLSEGLTPYCSLSVTQKNGLPSYLKDDALTWCSALSIGEFSAVNHPTKTGTTVHFSIHPNENFSFQNPSIFCHIGEVHTSKNLFTERFVSKKKDNTEQKKRQAGTTCTPDTNNRIYLGQENITICLEQNPKAEFFFGENIDFSLFTDEAQNKFPLFNLTTPFSGHLTMPPFSLNNFHITRTDNAAFFGTIANSTINANFSNVMITNTNCNSNTALLTNTLSGYNTIFLEIDTAEITACGRSVGGVVSKITKNSSGSIVFKIKERSTIKTINTRPLETAVGTVIGDFFLDEGSRYDVTVIR